MALEPRIQIPHDEIAEFCKRNHIRKLPFFGSVLRDDFSDDSDVDVLVEFKEGKTPGFEFARMQLELAETLGREVHLMTPGFFSGEFRERVIEEAQIEYESI